MTITSFSEFTLSSALHNAISDMGFTEPTPIQKQTIPLLLHGSDLAGQAHTGTGKTAAYAIPSIERCNPDDLHVQVLVLCPTRELALQIASEYSRLLKYNKKVRVVPIYGGDPIDRQIKLLQRGVQICVGTPGRILDHISRKTLDFSYVHYVVLDEADQMLDMGFRPDIETIMGLTPQTRQTVIFSATIPKPIYQISSQFQKDPVIIRVVHEDIDRPEIDQYSLEIREDVRDEALCRILSRYIPKRCLIFVNTRKMADRLSDILKNRGYSASALHGDMSQRERNITMNGFRSGKIPILVATDVAARGIDVDDVEMVFNYELPQDNDQYVHRIGRTARAGKSGRSVSVILPRDRGRLHDIQRRTRVRMRRMNIPSDNEIRENQVKGYGELIKARISKGEMASYEPIINSLIEEGINPIQISTALLSLHIEQNIQNPFTEPSEDLDENQYQERNLVRISIGSGKLDGMSPRKIINIISASCRVPPRIIGDIIIHPTETIIEVPSWAVKKIIFGVKRDGIEGRSVDVILYSDYQNFS